MEGLGELPPGWAWARLGDVCEVNPLTSIAHLEPGAEVAFVPMAAVAELSNGIDVSKRRPLAEVTTGFTRFSPDDVLFAKITPCMENGKIAVVPDVPGRVAFGSTEFHVLRVRPGIEPLFVRHFVAQDWFRRDARGAMSGAVGQQRVPAAFVRDAPIALAPSAEQARIVAELTTLFTDLDEAEAALARARTGLAEYRASLLHAACTGQLTSAWRASRPAPAEDGPALLRRILAERRAAWERAELARLTAKGKPAPKSDAWKARYQEPPLPDTEALPVLPKGWVWASVEQLMAEPARNGVSVEGRPKPPGTPALRLDALTASGLRFDRCRYIEIPAAKASALFIVAGDFLVSRANGSLHLVGRGCLASQPPQPTIFPDTMIRLRFALPCIGMWASLLWQARLIRQQFERRAKTTAGIWKISQEDLQATLIPLPPEPEMAEASRQIAAATMDGSELPDGVAATLRQSILHAAFTGRLVPQDPADEPAATLLARLRAAPAPSRARRPRTQAAP